MAASAPIDPKRIAIYGGSYGGYTTLAGLAFTPDLYAAGVDYVGVSNLITFMKSVPPYWKPFLEMMAEMVGDMEKDEAMLKAASPVFSADKIKAPLLIAQGAKDPRVAKAESDQMVEAMKSAASRSSTSSRTTKATASATRKTGSSSMRRWSAS